MGNQPNDVIRCGFQDKQTKDEMVVASTEQAIANMYGQSIPRRKKIYSFTDRHNRDHSSKTAQEGREHQMHSNSQSGTQQLEGSPLLKSVPHNQPDFIPQHENLTRISYSAVPGYVLRESSQGRPIYHENYDKCLDEIIEARYNTSMHFPEGQMITLLQSLVYSLAYIKRRKLRHHDFYPTNIYYDEGIFRVLHPYVLECSSYSITKQRRRFSFLAPDIIKSILQDVEEEQMSAEVMFKGDIFSIGMTMLEFCTLKPSSECYDPDTYQILQHVINERTSQCSTVYNPAISECIALMLQTSVDRRPDVEELALGVSSRVREIKNANGLNARSIPSGRGELCSMSRVIIKPQGLQKIQNASRITTNSGISTKPSDSYSVRQNSQPRTIEAFTHAPEAFIRAPSGYSRTPDSYPRTPDSYPRTPDGQLHYTTRIIGEPVSVLPPGAQILEPSSANLQSLKLSPEQTNFLATFSNQNKTGLPQKSQHSRAKFNPFEQIEEDENEHEESPIQGQKNPSSTPLQPSVTEFSNKETDLNINPHLLANQGNDSANGMQFSGNQKYRVISPIPTYPGKYEEYMPQRERVQPQNYISHQVGSKFPDTANSHGGYPDYSSYGDGLSRGNSPSHGDYLSRDKHVPLPDQADSLDERVSRILRESSKYT